MNMNVNNLTLNFGFMNEHIYRSLGRFIVDNIHLDFERFENNGMFCILNEWGLLKLNDEHKWLTFGEKSKPFKIDGLDGKYIIKFTDGENVYDEIKNAIINYRTIGRTINCFLEIYNYDIFWRPKRIEIDQFYNGR